MWSLDLSMQMGGFGKRELNDRGHNDTILYGSHKWAYCSLGTSLGLEITS